MKYHKKQSTSTSRSVRITSGLFRGREIKTPPLSHSMGSRERLALFNSLGERTKNSSVLDAFAGSGALGIEALSRDAKEVVFIENSPVATKIIKENLQDLRLLADKFAIKQGSAKDFPEDKQFDLILIDPPYDDFHLEDFQNLTKNLRPGGLLALSHPADFDPATLDLKLLSDKKYAACHIAFFTNV